MWYNTVAIQNWLILSFVIALQPCLFFIHKTESSVHSDRLRYGASTGVCFIEISQTVPRSLDWGGGEQGRRPRSLLHIPDAEPPSDSVDPRTRGISVGIGRSQNNQLLRSWHAFLIPWRMCIRWQMRPLIPVFIEIDGLITVETGPETNSANSASCFYFCSLFPFLSIYPLTHHQIYPWAPPSCRVCVQTGRGLLLGFQENLWNLRGECSKEHGHNLPLP